MNYFKVFLFSVWVGLAPIIIGFHVTDWQWWLLALPTVIIAPLVYINQ
jgi:hypothetical protein